MVQAKDTAAKIICVSPHPGNCTTIKKRIGKFLVLGNIASTIILFQDILRKMHQRKHPQNT